MKKPPRGWRRGRTNMQHRQTWCLPRLPIKVQLILSAEWARSVLTPSVEEAIGEADARSMWRVLEIADKIAYTPFPTKDMMQDASDFSAYLQGAIDYDWSDAPEEVMTTKVLNAGYAVAGVGVVAASVCANNDVVPWNRRVEAAASRIAGNAAKAGARWEWMYETYLAARGPRVKFDPQWRTPTTRALAESMTSTRKLGSMPILADALEEAGCNSARLLKHLRKDTGTWTRADWVLWNLVGATNPNRYKDLRK